MTISEQKKINKINIENNDSSDYDLSIETNDVIPQP